MIRTSIEERMLSLWLCLRIPSHSGQNCGYTWVYGIRYTMAYPFSGFFRYPSHVIFTCSWPGNGIPGTGVADGSARSSDAGHGPGSLGSGRVPPGSELSHFGWENLRTFAVNGMISPTYWMVNPRSKFGPENMGWFPKLNNHSWSLVYVYSKLCKKRHCGALKS